MEQDLPNIKSLFDFVYVDTKRIASYLAQLDPNGTLTGIKTTASSTMTLNAQAKVSVAVAGGTLTGTDAAVEGVERQFDPVWSLPIAMLDRLDELRFVRRQMHGAPIGSLVLVSGHMQIMDIRMLQEIWPSVATLIDFQNPAARTANRQERRREQKDRSEQKDREPASFNATTAEMLKKLPHALELHFLTDDGMIWATLNPENMVVSSDDFALKHGTTIPGQWYMLGILDSYYGHDSRRFVEIWQPLPMSEIAKILMNFTETVKQKLGRPNHTYAMTPIVIFRSVDAAADEAGTTDVLPGEDS